jgi:hypothetical protein
MKPVVVRTFMYAFLLEIIPTEQCRVRSFMYAFLLEIIPTEQCRECDAFREGFFRTSTCANE